MSSEPHSACTTPPSLWSENAVLFLQNKYEIKPNISNTSQDDLQTFPEPREGSIWNWNRFPTKMVNLISSEAPGLNLSQNLISPNFEVLTFFSDKILKIPTLKFLRCINTEGFWRKSTFYLFTQKSRRVPAKHITDLYMRALKVKRWKTLYYNSQYCDCQKNRRSLGRRQFYSWKH